MLKRIMPAVEFEQWILFHRDSPIDDQSNHHLPVAQLTAYVAAANRGKNDPPKKISDFMLFKKKPEDDGDDGVSMDALMGAGW